MTRIGLFTIVTSVVAPSKLTFDPKVVRALAIQLSNLIECSILNSSKESSNLWAIAVYRAKDGSLSAKSPLAWQTTRFESQITWRCLIPISRATIRPVRYASYSAILLVHGKSSLNDIVTVSPVFLDRTILARPSEVVEDSSKRKVQTSPTISISAISGNSLSTLSIMFQLFSLGKFDSKSVMAWPLTAVRVISMISNSDNYKSHCASLSERTRCLKSEWIRWDSVKSCIMWTSR